MDIIASNYHRDITENGLKTYLHSDKIGIQNLENGKKTLPTFDRVVTSDKYIFVEANNHWGILNLDLRLIASPVYIEIFPVKQIDRNTFISGCLSNQYAVSVTLNSNSSKPTHIAIQKREVNTSNKYGIDLGDLDFSNHVYAEEDEACIYEVANSLERAEGLLVTITDEEIQLINIDETEIKLDSGFRGYDFFPLWHYKDNMFIVYNKNGSYTTSTYKDGRFTKKSLFGEYNDGFEEEGSPKIIIHRNEFVSVCYPQKYRITGFPNTKQFQDKENAFHEKCGKWALFKYFHTENPKENNLKDIVVVADPKRTCFEPLTSFVYKEPMTQTNDDNAFICHGEGHDIFMRFEERQFRSNTDSNKSSEVIMKELDLIKEKNEKQKDLISKVGRQYETFPSNGGNLEIKACYNTIELREDRMFDVSTADGYGLCNKDMQVIVPAKYDYPIEDWGNQLVIVSKDGKYGVINQKAEEIIPFNYDYIQIGKDEFHIWDKVSEWDDFLNQSVSNYLIRSKMDIDISDEDLTKEGYLIIGIINGVQNAPVLTSEPKTLFGKLAHIAAKKPTLDIHMTHCDVYSPNGLLLSKCEVSKSGVIEYDKEIGVLVIYDYLKRYGIYIQKSSNRLLTSDDFSDNSHSLSGNSLDGYSDLEEIIITKDIHKVEWNGLGRCRFRKFNVAPENKVFCEVGGVLYTQKGYDRKGETYRKHMIELVACPTLVSTHNVTPGTIRIANCAFKGSMIETLQLPDTLEEIGVNAFYHTPNLKYLKLPMSIRKIEAQNVSGTGDLSMQIEYNSQNFVNWNELYEYLLRNGFEKRNGNMVIIK